MRLLTENFRDKAHFPYVHADSMGHVDKVVEPYRILRDGWQLGWSSSLASEGVSADLAEELSHQLDYRITLPVFASICVSSPSGGRRLVAQVATPVSADGLRVRQSGWPARTPCRPARGPTWPMCSALNSKSSKRTIRSWRTSDRGLADAEFACDLAIAASVPDEEEHLTLAFAQQIQFRRSPRETGHQVEVTDVHVG